MKKRSVAKIGEVAELAGVSTATVSRTLAQPGFVSESTRKKVHRAIAKTGYRANNAARNLRSRKAGAIIVLVPNLGKPFFSSIIGAITEVAAANGFSVLISDTQINDRFDPHMFELAQDGRADGIIMLDGALPPAKIAECNLPVVLACEWDKHSEIPGIAVDNSGGAYRAVEHLYKLGHRSIGHVSGPPDNILCISRQNGYTDAMADFGLPMQADWMFGSDFSVEAGAEAALRWMENKDRPTGLFCASDELAIGFISKLHEHGIDVPNDVSVVGFDDIKMAEYFIPALTTIRQPRDTLGRQAAEMLISAIKNNRAPTGNMSPLPVELMVRGSTAKPKE